MNTLTRNQQWLIGGILLLAMIITRSHLISHIQDASWAIFFMVGFYLRSYLSFPIFWLAAFAIDLIVIESHGGQSYCFTPSYPFLIPAYAALWAAGHWFSKLYREDFRGLFSLAATAIIGIAVCFLISNAGFYWFSGRFTEMNMLEYTQRLAKYMPMYLQTTLLQLGIAALIHTAVIQTRKLSGHAHHS